jgi:hypothetical protein
MEKSINSKQIPESLVASVKSRFFAQYIGQEILRWHQWIETTPDSKVDLSVPAIEKSGWFIKLKPLSKITDEDAIEIIKIIDSKSNKFINVNYSFAEKKEPPYIKSVISDKGRFDINNNFVFIIDKQVIDFSLNIFDYLRSKGYAVPFMEYSVEDLVSFGWVQLV